MLLQSQNLPQDQLVLVKNQVDELAVKIRAPNAPPLTFTPTPSTPVPAFQPPMLSQPVAAPPPVAPVSTATAPVSLDSLLGKGALAALLSRAQSVTPQVSTPQPPPPALPAAIRSPAPQQATPQVPATSQPPNPMALLASLRSAGIILPPTPAMSAAPAPVPVPPPAAAAPPIIPPNIADILASARALVPQRPPPMDPMTVTADLQLKTASLKQYVSYCPSPGVSVYQVELTSPLDTDPIFFPHFTSISDHPAPSVADGSEQTRTAGRRRQPTWTGTSACTSASPSRRREASTGAGTWTRR